LSASKVGRAIVVIPKGGDESRSISLYAKLVEIWKHLEYNYSIKEEKCLLRK